VGTQRFQVAADRPCAAGVALGGDLGLQRARRRNVADKAAAIQAALRADIVRAIAMPGLCCVLQCGD
jgi:hypothetical protein